MAVTPPFLPLFHTLLSQWESLTLYRWPLLRSGHWSETLKFGTVRTSLKRPLPPCGMTNLKFVIVFNPLPASTWHLCALYILRYSEFQHGTARILYRSLYAIIFFINSYVRPLPGRDPLCFDPRKRALNLSICGYWSLEVRLYSLINSLLPNHRSFLFVCLSVLIFCCSIKRLIQKLTLSGSKLQSFEKPNGYGYCAKSSTPSITSQQNCHLCILNGTKSVLVISTIKTERKY